MLSLWQYLEYMHSCGRHTVGGNELSFSKHFVCSASFLFFASLSNSCFWDRCFFFILWSDKLWKQTVWLMLEQILLKWADRSSKHTVEWQWDFFVAISGISGQCAGRGRWQLGCDYRLASESACYENKHASLPCTATKNVEHECKHNDCSLCKCEKENQASCSPAPDI